MDHPTESQPEMEFEDLIMWTNICVCLPLTTLVIFWVLCVVKREQAPVIYYINLLTSNLIQFIATIFLKSRQHMITITIYIVLLMVSVYFRMSIAMERCFVITRPQSNWIRQTGWSMLVSVLVWILCIIIFPLSMVFQPIPIFVFSLLLAPLFILFLAWTFKVLPAATSVPTDEKRRIVGTVVLLFIQYFLMSVVPIIYFICAILSFQFSDINITLVLFLLSPYVDLILAFFMQKGPIDKLLSCLCCCIMDGTAADVAEYQQLHEREKVNQTVEKSTKHESLQILR